MLSDSVCCVIPCAVWLSVLFDLQVYVLGTILSMQISFVGFQPVQSSEHMAVSHAPLITHYTHAHVTLYTLSQAFGLFGLCQIHAFVDYLRSKLSKSQFEFLFKTLALIVAVGVVIVGGTLTFLGSILSHNIFYLFLYNDLFQWLLKVVYLPSEWRNNLITRYLCVFCDPTFLIPCNVGFVTLFVVCCMILCILWPRVCVSLTTSSEISPWTGRFYSLLDPSYAKNNIPIIASVSEHQPTTWSSFYFDLQILVFLFPGKKWVTFLLNWYNSLCECSVCSRTLLLFFQAHWPEHFYHLVWHNICLLCCECSHVCV